MNLSKTRVVADIAQASAGVAEVLPIASIALSTSRLLKRSAHLSLGKETP